MAASTLIGTTGCNISPTQMQQMIPVIQAAIPMIQSMLGGSNSPTTGLQPPATTFQPQTPPAADPFGTASNPDCQDASCAAGALGRDQVQVDLGRGGTTDRDESGPVSVAAAERAVADARRVLEEKRQALEAAQSQSLGASQLETPQAEFDAAQRDLEVAERRLREARAAAPPS